MSSRLENMRKVNEVRSWTTMAMIFLLDDFEEGLEGDYDGFERWGIYKSYELRGQLNSYRAQKIAQFLGKTISKQRLTKYSKPRGYVYNLTNSEINEWLIKNEKGLHSYWSFHKNCITGGY